MRRQVGAQHRYGAQGWCARRQCGNRSGRGRSSRAVVRVDERVRAVAASPGRRPERCTTKCSVCTPCRRWVGLGDKHGVGGCHRKHSKGQRDRRGAWISGRTTSGETSRYLTLIATPVPKRPEVASSDPRRHGLRPTNVRRVTGRFNSKEPPAARRPQSAGIRTRRGGGNPRRNPRRSTLRRCNTLPRGASRLKNGNPRPAGC